MKRLALVLLLVACGKGGDGEGGGGAVAADDDGYAFAPSARIDGSIVVIEVACPPDYASWEINGKTAMCEKGKTSTVAIPAATLGAGHKELEAKLRYKKKSRTAKVSFDVPDTATGPFVSVDRCEDDGDYKGSTSIELVVDGKQKVFCHTFGGARTKLVFKATPGGKLVLGDAAPLDIPATGELAKVIELAPAILALKVDDAIGRDAGPTIELPYKLDANGKSVSGKLGFGFHSFDWQPLLARFFRDIGAGKIDRPAFTAPGARKNILYVHEDRDIKIVDRRGTLKDLALVAIAAEGDPVEHGTCEFESKGQKITAKRFDIALTVTVTSLADGTIVQTKTFPAKADCPMFEMFDPAKPESKVKADPAAVMKWLETLAK